LNRARIAISVIFAVGCVCFAANGQKASSDSKESEEPKVQSVTSPSFNPTNYNKIGIVWPNPPKPAQADNSQQSIDDEFTFALMQKGYDVIPPSDAQTLLKDQPVAKTSGSAEPDTTKIGKLLNVPAVMVISVSGLNSKPYVAPSPEKATTSTSSAAGGVSNPFAGMSNPLSYITPPTNSFKIHGWGITLPDQTPPKDAAQPKNAAQQKNAAQPKGAAQPRATAPAASATPKGAEPAAPKAAPQFLNSCSMSARLFSVEDSRILWIGKVTVNSVSSSAQDYSESIKAAADAIAQAIPSRTEEKQ
jgi:hypothetical protein